MNGRLQSLKTPTSIVLIVVTTVSLVCAALLAGELYARYRAVSLIRALVYCTVADDATVSIDTVPPLLVQAITGHYADISIATAGRQIRNAKGMKVAVDIQDVVVNGSGGSAGTVGSLSATIAWTDDGIKRTAQEQIPMLGGFVSNVTSDPSAGTIALQGPLGGLAAKPLVVDGALSLQIQSIKSLGITMGRDGLQQAWDKLASNMKSRFPMGLHVDKLSVSRDGVIVSFSAHDISMPTSAHGSCSVS